MSTPSRNLPSIAEMTISEERSLRDVLAVVDKNAQNVAFLVNSRGVLTGVLTDGDIRRALLKGIGLTASAHEIVAKTFVSKNVKTSREELNEILSPKVRHIPLVDDEGKLVDYACVHRLHQIPVMEPFLRGNELSYVVDCVSSGWISSQGKYVTRFEEEFAKICGGGHAVAVSNGTVALHLAMVTLGIGLGDEVLVPNLTFAASINTVILAGATPVLVDVDPETWCIDPQALEAVLTPQTKAIMPVHLYGYPCEMKKLQAFAKKHGLLIVEDAAEAFGTTYEGKSAGLFGEAGCFSFFGNKMITTGEGGMVVFRDEKMAARGRMLRDHGMAKDRRYWHLEVGFNYRMTNLQAAIGVAQLEQFDIILKAKLDLAKAYEKALSDVSGITLPPSINNGVSTYWLYTVLIDESRFGPREQFMAKLLANGIESRPVFFPLHEMPPYQKYVRPGQSFPESIRISRQGLSLPSSATLKTDEIQRICSTLRRLSDVRGLYFENETPRKLV